MNALDPRRCERLRLFVKEVGSAPLSSGGSDAFDETLVVAQMPGEAAAGFAQRVIERVVAVERSGRWFGSARVQTGGLHDSATYAARRLILMALASHCHAPGSRLELALEADAAADEQTRREFVDLVDSFLLAVPKGKAVPVRLRFESQKSPPASPSGVFWSAPKRCTPA